MERHTNKATRRKCPLVVELIGLAGSGKTTLACALSQRQAGFQVAADLSLRRRQHAAFCLACSPRLATLLLRQGRSLARFDWEDVKAMLYLTAWPRVLRKQAGDSTTAVLLDHGPIFKLATLYAFGPDVLGERNWQRWWSHTVQQWATTLDMVVHLGAPDEVLVQRINSRSQRHPVKGRSETEAYRFLTRYQVAYEAILAQVSAHRPPMLLQFATDRFSTDAITDEVLAACERVVAARRQRVSAHGPSIAQALDC